MLLQVCKILYWKGFQAISRQTTSCDFGVIFWFGVKFCLVITPKITPWPHTENAALDGALKS
ncbi:hypothetical protein [Chromobacterium sp.]|uniref:hypothetical protein n=1 Tax=Chromobacterium sp. TaxID=306190 RepID=UPI0035B1BC1F